MPVIMIDLPVKPGDMSQDDKIGRYLALVGSMLNQEDSPWLQLALRSGPRSIATNSPFAGM